MEHWKTAKKAQRHMQFIASLERETSLLMTLYLHEATYIITIQVYIGNHHNGDSPKSRTDK
jgi:hypothetical protein